MLGHTLTLPLRETCPYWEFSWSVFFRIQPKCGKIRTRKTPNTDAFQAVGIFSVKILTRKLTEQMRIQNPVKNLTSGFQPVTIFVTSSILDI